jgi:fibronectin type 3 domain-containing protein
MVAFTMSAKHLFTAIILALVVLGGCLADPPSTGSTEQAVAPQPQNLMGSAVSPTRIQLTWDPVPTATKYVIMRGPTPGSAVSYTSAPPVASYTNGHILPGEQTCWQVKSVVGSEVSIPSNEVCITTPAAPGAPTNVVATAISESRIDVTWTAVAGAIRYYVHQATDVAGPYSNIGTATGTSFSSTNLTAATQYFYKIQTQFSGGTSALSEPPASATTFGAGLQAYWRLDEDAGTVANDSSGFNRHGTLIGGAAFSGDKAPIHNNTSAVAVPGGTGDAISVPHSNAFNLQTSPGPGPDATIAMWVKLPIDPGGASVSIIGKRVAGCSGTLTWEIGQDASNQLHFRGTSVLSFGQNLPVGEWTHVAVTRIGTTTTLYLNGAQVASGTVAVGAANMAPLQIGNSGGCGGSSLLVDDVRILSLALSAAEVAVLGDAPDAPTNLVGLAISPTRIQLNWDAVAGAENYVIYRGTGPGNAVFYTNTDADDSQYDNGHILPEETTSWQVGVVVNGLISPPSNEVVLTTPGAPPPPTNVTATAVSQTRINLSWDAVPSASKYYVYQSTGGGAFIFKGTALATTFGATGLMANTMYTYVVRTVANDNVTQSVDSAPASATTLP